MLKRMSEGGSQDIRKGLYPSISAVIPTLNSSKTLRECLESIRIQEYPGEVEVIIADGGSTDETLQIAREFGCTVVPNRLRTGEAGKATGIRSASGEIVALIDSDNVLPENDWFLKMTEPFSEHEICGSEPLFYTRRASDPPLTRYFAMLGMSDPLCLFIGNYDRISLVTGKWTGLKIDARDRGNYFELTLEADSIPTIGANGFFIRRALLEEYGIEDYLFDVDLVFDLVRKGKNKFAKVKTGIVHLYCDDLGTFARKQLRRVRDYRHFASRGKRTYPWKDRATKGVFRFVLSCILFVPLVFQALKGYARKRDSAWMYHIPACLITLAIYSYGFFESLFKTAIHKRDGWKQ